MMPNHFTSYIRKHYMVGPLHRLILPMDDGDDLHLDGWILASARKNMTGTPGSEKLLLFVDHRGRYFCHETSYGWTVGGTKTTYRLHANDDIFELIRRIPEGQCKRDLAAKCHFLLAGL